jgi:uncharacterized membrane protein
MEPISDRYFRSAPREGTTCPSEAALRRLGNRVRHTTIEEQTMKMQIAVAAAIAAAVAGANIVQAQGKTEKCYGVAKAAQNDCQTATSSCAGTSKKDNQGDAWLTLPAGACAKIVGGSLTAKKA